MSAIGGIVAPSGRGIDPAQLDAMAAVAPGFTGGNASHWGEGDAGLLRVALATTPEALAEQQPYRDEPSGAVIAFDGRCDNREEIRARIGPDAPPRDAPDCVIVLAAWLAMGPGLLDILAGDYALAVWEPRERRLSCARSPVGWRPLLWTELGGRFAFASEPAMLVRGLGLSPAINEGLIAEHLSSRFVSETETFWQGIYRLPPGHLLTVDAGGMRTRRWLDGPFEDHARLSERDHVERFNHLFDQALVATMRSAGPVVAQLSGGLDSSSIVCRSHEMVESGAIAAMPATVSARYPGEACDEGAWIEAVEAKCGITAHQVFDRPYDWQAAGEWSARTLHLPLRPNTLATTVASCDWLNETGAHVMLTGEGGDDWLNGSFAHFPDLLRQGRWPTLLREGLSEPSGHSFAGRLRWTMSSAVGPLVSARRQRRLLRPHLHFELDIPNWISPGWAQRIGLIDRWRSAPPPPMLGGMAQAQRYGVYSLARRHVNVDNVLAFAASRSVELRHPMHDFRLTRFLMGAAGGVLMRNGARKHLLREAMRGTLPELVRERRTKANMSAPIYAAVAERLRERPVSEMITVRNGWVDGAKLQEIEGAFAHWRANGGPAPTLPYSAVWNALATDLWLEHAAGMR